MPLSRVPPNDAIADAVRMTIMPINQSLHVRSALLPHDTSPDSLSSIVGYAPGLPCSRLARVLRRSLTQGRPRAPTWEAQDAQEKRQTIVETYRLVKSQLKTAKIHGVAESTAKRILREARPKLEDYPDVATELI
jgi:hypothetical protein